MPSRGVRPVLFLVATLVALVLSGGGDLAADERDARADQGTAALGSSMSRPEAAGARLSGNERRDSGAPRSSKPRLVLLAVVVTLVGMALPVRRRSVPRVATAPLRSPWWVPRHGRAPPSFPALTA